MHRTDIGYLVYLWVLLLAAVAGCGSEAADDGSNDAADDLIAAIDSGDAAVDVVPGDVADNDDALPCESLGCPCEDDAECESGYCLDAGAEGWLCGGFCTDECDDERFECRLLENSGGDAVRLCVPIDQTYCNECESALDCGSLRAVCVELADGSRGCAPPCGEDGLCPLGAICESLQDGPDLRAVCVPESGMCRGCLDLDGDRHGVGPECDGPDHDDLDDTSYEGAPERCDSVDNDGDAEVDEGFDLTTDSENCGECGIVCAVDGGDAACADGSCVVTGCPDGFADCDADHATGCEIDLSDPLRCGTCTLPGGAPGEACGACDEGVWTCDGAGSTTCEGDPGEDSLNACGGCEELDDAPGESCGICATGTWACDSDMNAVSCSGEDEEAGNLCGGCAEIEGVPGEACGECDDGTWICASPEVISCVGASATNECGGCGALAGVIGAACGTCDSGAWACDPELEDATCGGDPGDGALNACGGCVELDNEPGSVCGSCGLDEFVCAGTDATVCDGDTTVNACGGCAELDNEPGSACGGCGLDAYVCAGTDATACDGDTTANACGGCGELSAEPDDVCGTCDSGTIACETAESVICDGDLGDSALNACGGCSELAAEPGEACDACGLIRCDGTDGIECAPAWRSLDPARYYDFEDVGDAAFDRVSSETQGVPEGEYAVDLGAPMSPVGEGTLSLGATGAVPLALPAGLLSSDFSVSMWVRPSSERLAGYTYAFWNRAEPCAGTAVAMTPSDGWQFDFGTGECPWPDVLFEGGTVVNDGAQHVVATRSGGNHRLYVDGIQVVEADIGVIGALESPAQLGFTEHTVGGQRPFVGELDDVAFFDRALSVDEVRTMWRGTCTACGDGVVDPGEACDDGNTSTETECPYGTPLCEGCDATCDAVLPLTGEFCGDGALSVLEECDDGNVDDGDGCDSECTFEPMVDCRAILEAGFSTGDGTYWVDPDGEGAFEVFCDMTTDGGGWMLVAAVHRTETRGLPEPAGWFAVEQNTAPLVAGELIFEDPLSSHGVAAFDAYVAADPVLARFTIHAHLDEEQTYSWFKAAEPASFAEWFGNDTTPTTVCHDPELTDRCEAGRISAYVADATNLEGMVLPEPYGAGSSAVHMRLDVNGAPGFSGICSSTGDDPDWADSFDAGGHWGNALTIWLRR